MEMKKMNQTETARKYCTIVQTDRFMILRSTRGRKVKAWVKPYFLRLTVFFV